MKKKVTKEPEVELTRVPPKKTTKKVVIAEEESKVAPVEDDSQWDYNNRGRTPPVEPKETA